MSQENLEPTPAADNQPAPAAQFQFRFERFSAFVEEYTSTISLEGMFLKTREPRPVGTVVAFDIRLADGFQLIHGQGEVVWMRPDGLGEEQPGGMGIRFQALSDKGRELILKILDEHLKAGGQPFEVGDIPPGAVSSPGQGGAGSAIGGMDFDAPWGAKLPDVPSEFLDEAASGGASTEAASPAGMAAAASPAPPVDDVFALSTEEDALAADDVLTAGSAGDVAGEEVLGGGGDSAFELEAVPEFDTDLGSDEEVGGLPSFGDQQSLPGLEPLAGTASAAAVNEGADWDIQPTEDFDEEPTLIGAAPSESSLLGDEEPTLMSLNSAEAAAPPAAAPPPPTAESPLAEELPSFEPQEAAAAAAEFSDPVAENPFAAETFPEPETSFASAAGEFTPAPSEASPEVSFPATEPVLEEVGGGEGGSWDAPEPTPTFAMDSAPADPFATDTLQAGSYPTDSAPADPFATDSIATAKIVEGQASFAAADDGAVADSFPAAGSSPVVDSFAAPDSFAAEEPGDASGLPTGDSWEPPKGEADPFAAAAGEGFSPSAGAEGHEPPSFESPVSDVDSTEPGVVEGELVGPFQFEDYDLEESASGGPSAFQRLRKPLLGLAVVAVLAAVAFFARGPILELFGGGEPDPIATGPTGPPVVAEEAASTTENFEPTAGEGESVDSGAVGEMGAGLSGAELGSEGEGGGDIGSGGAGGAAESPSPAPSTAETEFEVAENTSPPTPEPRTESTRTELTQPAVSQPPPLTPPATSSVSRGTTTAQTVMDISTRRERGGTLAVITLDGSFDPRSAVVDVMAWDPDSEKLVLGGIREPFYPANVQVNSAELGEIRTGHHPGPELWIVFDFTSSEFSLEAPEVHGDRIEILIR